MYGKAKERVEQGERTISNDEMTGVQALERISPDLPMEPASPEVPKGRVVYREFEYKRHGTLSWFINSTSLLERSFTHLMVQRAMKEIWLLISKSD